MSMAKPFYVTVEDFHLSQLRYYLFRSSTMLGLVAIALLLLAFFYCKRSQEERDPEDGGEGCNIRGNETDMVCEERILVIMPGETEPTFFGIAKPISRQ
ncbi:glutamine dumper 5 [Euphorbia peplus]|nr:glutamine dumper 5 [Euphorbia peplus]